MLVGTGELENLIKEYVKSLGISNSVIFAGFRNDTEEFYQVFDLFLMPSLFEGLPFVGIEAQASGLPCLFADSITKEIGILETTRFESLDSPIANWIDAINELLKYKRRDTSKEISNAGYNIEMEAQKLYDYYNNLI